MIMAAQKADNDQWATSAGHWYTRDGRPMYEVPNASRPGSTRPTTIRDARKLGLVPSVSTILKCEAKPQLTNWIRDQGMMACLTLPRLPGEDDTAFMKRALADSDAQKNKAADRGTQLHGYMEEWLRHGRAPDVDESELAYVRPAVEWVYREFDGYAWDPESSFAYTSRMGHGYGGKRDLCGIHPSKPPVVIDHKCKSFPAGSAKKLAYPEHASQLAAYGAPYERDHRGVNIFVSTEEPGLFVPHEWEWKDLVRAHDAFQALLWLWYSRNEL